MISTLLTRSLKNNLIFLTLILPTILVSQEFEINGDFEGNETDQLILTYHDLSNEFVMDTLEITDGKFQTKGIVNGVQRVYFTGKTSSESIEDPNLAMFFLGPGKIDLSLKENEFKNIKVRGSEIQSEFESFQKKIKPLREEINKIYKEFLLADQNKEYEKVSQLQTVLRIKNEEISDLEIEYAFRNPDSYLSSYYGNMHKRRIGSDSLKILYNNFSPRVAGNGYTQKIEDYLNIETMALGDKAPSFSSLDSNGKEIDLDSFKGRYVLLDFWAGWCKPCIKMHPELKELHKRYNSKGLEILGVSFDKDEAEWKKNISEQNLDRWPHIFVGLDNVRRKGSIPQLYNVQPIPAYILINDKGELVGRYLSASSERNDISELEKTLEEIFE